LGDVLQLGNMFQSFFKKIRLGWQVPLCLLLLLFVLQAGAPATAQVGLESRVARLESDLFGLKQQVNQLEARSRRVNSSSTAPSTPTASASNRPQYSSDPMFDRLATLVIELKERLNAVETRLTKLEAKTD
jgi:uncharacterized protein YceH (UPF0502 family)